MSRKIAQKWLKQALHDLDMAEKNIAIGGYDVSAFLAHQCVEKLLKAVYAGKGLRVPRTHFIDEIAADLGIENGDILSDISDLTVDYTFARYPDVADRVPYEEYDETIEVQKAKRVFEYLLREYAAILEHTDE